MQRFPKDAFVAQSVEQLTLNQLVDGSNPPEGTKPIFTIAFVAQSVEQLTLNQLVDGSNPPEGTIFQPHFPVRFFLFLRFIILIFLLHYQKSVILDIYLAMGVLS